MSEEAAQGRFQMAANLADEAFMKTGANLSGAGFSREEICSGALFAVVRMHVRMAPKPHVEALIFRLLIQAAAATLRAVLRAEAESETAPTGKPS